MSYVSIRLIEAVSGSVNQSEVDDISVFHNNIRSLLEPNYETFLQGSYANDTAISNINDVDIVALKTSNNLSLPMVAVTDYMFNEIKTLLESNNNYYGQISTGRKCLTLELSTKKADIVPAVRSFFIPSLNQYNEPIQIAGYRNNYPKTHKEKGRQKNMFTNGNYKKIVRMLKNYAYNWNIRSIAPSFYIESMIFSYPNTFFSNDLVQTIRNILVHMIGDNFNINFTSVAGDKPIVSQTEWQPQSFFAFKQHIINNINNLDLALSSNNDYYANYYFRQFFNIQSRWV